MAFESEQERIFQRLNIKEIVKGMNFVEFGKDYVRFKSSDLGDVFEIRVSKKTKNK